MVARVRQLPHLARRLAGATRVAPIRALGPLAHRVHSPDKGGVLLVGDAGGFYDPFTGEGVFTALRSAELAVTTMVPALRSGDVSVRALAGYSREQEFQADELGVRYLARAGYDPTAMSSFLTKLERNDQLMRRLAGRDDADPATSWFATHPRTPDRVLRAAEQASATVAGEARIGRDDYLAQIDGMIYGQDPSQGYMRGRTFVHPELRFAFDVPPGYRIVNTPAAVIGQTRNGLMKFDTARVPAPAPQSEPVPAV